MTEARIEGLITLFKKELSIFKGVEVNVNRTKDDAISITTEVFGDVMIQQLQIILDKIKRINNVSPRYAIWAKDGMVEIKYRENEY